MPPPPHSSRGRARPSVRGNEALVAYLAEEVGQAVLTLRGYALPGLLGACLGTGGMLFHVDPDVVPNPMQPRPGEVARLDYRSQDVWTWFDTQVLQSTGGQYRLAPPPARGQDCRRLVPRHKPQGDKAFDLRLLAKGFARDAGDGKLLDVSTDGLGFLFWPHLAGVELGQKMRARLTLPGGLMLPVWLRVVNQRPAFKNASRQVAGARFLGMSIEERLDLAMSLHLWERRRSLT